MGSFTEFVIAFEFRQDVPDSILRAFAPWETPGGRLAPLAATFELYDEEANDFADDESLAPVLTSLFEGMWTAYFPGTQSVVLDHNDHRGVVTWKLTARVHQKLDPAVVAGFLDRLGSWACPAASPAHPVFVGFVRHEYDDVPTLIWHRGEGFEFDGPATPAPRSVPAVPAPPLPQPEDFLPRAMLEQVLRWALPEDDLVPAGFVRAELASPGRPLCGQVPPPPEPVEEQVGVAFEGRVEGGTMEHQAGLRMVVSAYAAAAAATTMLHFEMDAIRLCCSEMPYVHGSDVTDLVGADSAMRFVVIDDRSGVQRRNELVFARKGRFVVVVRTRPPIDAAVANAALSFTLRSLP